MARSLWRLTVRDEFSAGHALRGYEGKCENLHGHNFAVEVTVEGRCLTPDTSLLLDFKTLKSVLKDVLEGLDHHTLNQTPPFDAVNPSSENLSRYIWQTVAAHLAGHPDPQTAAVRLVSVSVSEKSAQSTTYMEIQENGEPNTPSMPS